MNLESIGSSFGIAESTENKKRTILNILYGYYFRAIKGFASEMTRRGYQAIGAIAGMVFQEPHTIARVGAYFIKYKQKPAAYGLNEIKNERPPVLLFPGTIGTWNYLGGLATELEKKEYSVFVINFSFGGPTEEKRGQVNDKIEEIKRLYNEKFGKTTQVDLVAHSMGGNLAFASLFSQDCSSIERGELKFTREAKANPNVRKLINLACPTIVSEKEQLEKIGKINQVYNVNAIYDSLMGHKLCSLPAERVKELDAAHVGIVYHRDLAGVLDQMLT